MRRILFLLFALVAIAGPVAVSAQAPPCTCFCTGSRGATSQGAMPASECPARCQSNGNENMVVCAATPADFPGNLPRCFTRERCAAQEGDFDGGQPRECLPGEHYCYAKPGDNKIQLSVGIGGRTTVSDLGAYINLGYRFLLGAAMTLAIVMVMVGGVQYTMAGATGDVEAAKHRITNAVMGLLLLLGAYVILYTVNPNLVKLQAPRLPMVKTILSAGADTCETFKKNGFTIQPTSDTCGKTAEIKSGPTGTQVVGGSTCRFSTCTEAGKLCVPEGTKPGCYSCDQIVPNNSVGFTPSQALCNSLSLPDQVSVAGNLKVRNQCFQTSDPTMLDFFGATFATGQGTTLSANVGTCASMQLNCESIATCSAYEKVPVKAGSNSAKLEDLEPPSTLNLGGDVDLKTICELNPCKPLGRSVELQGGCVYSENLGLADTCRPRPTP